MFSCFAIELECYGCFWMCSILLFIYSFIYFWKLLLVHLMRTSMSLTGLAIASDYSMVIQTWIRHGHTSSPDHLEDQTWIMFSIKKNYLRLKKCLDLSRKAKRGRSIIDIGWPTFRFAQAYVYTGPFLVLPNSLVAHVWMFHMAGSPFYLDIQC